MFDNYGEMIVELCCLLLFCLYECVNGVMLLVFYFIIFDLGEYIDGI